MKKIKALGICTSPRKGKNTYTLLEKALEGCKSNDAETELISVSSIELTPCKGCSVCQRTHRCYINDGISEVLDAMQKSDVLLFGTPVFFYDVTAQCKMIIDRSYAVQPLNGNKVGGMLVSAGSMGGASAIATLNMFFAAQGISSAGYVCSLGNTGDNPSSLQSAHDLGEKAVMMAEALKASPQCFGMHNHYAYGTHTK